MCRWAPPDLRAWPPRDEDFGAVAAGVAWENVSDALSGGPGGKAA